MSKAYPAWFGSPTLIDRIDDQLIRGVPFEDALQETAEWAELRSEVIFQLRQYYEPSEGTVK